MFYSVRQADRMGPAAKEVIGDGPFSDAALTVERARFAVRQSTKSPVSAFGL
jgi:hypothetical protein